MRNVCPKISFRMEYIRPKRISRKKSKQNASAIPIYCGGYTMKNFRFVLSGMIIALYLMGSCSDSKSNEPADSAEPEEDGKYQDSPPEPPSPGNEDNADGSPPAPVFLSCKAVSETEITFEFSLPVNIVSLCFVPEHEIDEIKNGSTVTVTLKDNMVIGQNVTAFLTAEDEYENIIDISAGFKSRNTRVPLMRINELRTEYSKSASRAEFIELKISTAGNLSALRVIAASNYKNPIIYEFPPIEVKEGEYVVLHTRTLNDTCLDECGDNLRESGGTDSSPDARDLWIQGSAELLRKTDIVYILDQDDNVLDAVLLALDPSPVWKLESRQDCYPAHAEFLFNRNAWKSASGTIPSPADAVNTAEIKTSATRSVSRYETLENTRSAADWYVTPQNGATPGGPNRM